MTLYSVVTLYIVVRKTRDTTSDTELGFNPTHLPLSHQDTCRFSWKVRLRECITDSVHQLIGLFAVLNYHWFLTLVLYKCQTSIPLVKPTVVDLLSTSVKVTYRSVKFIG